MCKNGKTSRNSLVSFHRAFTSRFTVHMLQNSPQGPSPCRPSCWGCDRLHHSGSLEHCSFWHTNLDEMLNCVSPFNLSTQSCEKVVSFSSLAQKRWKFRFHKRFFSLLVCRLGSWMLYGSNNNNFESSSSRNEAQLFSPLLFFYDCKRYRSLELGVEFQDLADCCYAEKRKSFIALKEEGRAAEWNVWYKKIQFPCFRLNCLHK